jgi:hypothetical protein
MILSLYGTVARPAAAVVAGCGAVAGAVLLGADEPRVAGLDPDTLRYTLLAVLAVFGVAIPGIMAIRRAFAVPAWWGVLTFFIALTADAVVLGAGVVGFPGPVFLVLAVALSLLMCTAGLLCLAERQASRPPESRF